MKQQYLASNRGRVHLLASLVLAAAVGVALGSASHPVVGLVGGLGCIAVLGALGYALFILEVRTNSLVRSPQSRGGGPRTAATPAGAAATASSRSGGPVTTAGRGAARQFSSPDDGRTLWRLSTDLPSQPVRLATVAPASLVRHVPADEVVTMVPGYAAAELETGQYRALVLDRAALTRGPWAGAESAFGADLLRQLRELADVARRRRIPVLVLDAPVVADVGSADLRSLGDLVLPLPADEYPPEGAECSALLTALQRAAVDRFLPPESTSTHAARDVSHATVGSVRA